jgi:hypothetical protein
MSNLLNFINLNRFHIPEIISHYNYQNYTEIGIQKGDFLNYILKNTNLNYVYGVDPFKPCNGNECGWSHEHNTIIASQESQDKDKQICLEKLLPFKDRFYYINLSSLEYGLLIEDESLDIVFIDGDHSENGVTLDLEIYYKKIKKGGLIVGHDYGGNFYSAEPVVQVKQAVDKFCSANNIKYFVTTQDFKFHGESIQSFFIYKNKY